MRIRVVGLTLTAGLLVALGWSIGQQSLPAQQPKGGEKKSSRYQVVGAGLITAVLFDTETGQTWALSPGGYMGGPGNFGGSGQEFAWAPVTKFDDLESYRRWVKDQQKKRGNLWEDEKRLAEEQERLAIERERQEAEKRRKENEKKKD